MTVERALIRRGLSFPAGGSLLVVARQKNERSGSPVIPFNKPYVTGNELTYIAQAHANGHLAGNGQFSKACCAWLEERIGSQKALLTHSCTAALEMAAILSDVAPGDEVIMPSYTFVSTANAFVLRGRDAGVRRHPAGHAQPRRDADRGGDHAANPGDRRGPLRRRRRATWTRIMEIARRHDLLVIEDAAQGLIADYRGRPLGSIGHMAALQLSRNEEHHLAAKAAPC